MAHPSGAAEYINKILAEMEDIAYLSSDGASADILEYALLNAPARVLEVQLNIS